MNHKTTLLASCNLLQRCRYLLQQNFRNNLLTNHQNSSPNPTSCVPFRCNQTNAIKCWKCGVQKQSVFDLFCDKCHVIQEPHQKTNYFKIFNLDNNYDVDAKTLRDKYRQLQSLLHPDKFSSRTDDEKSISENYSSLVNKGYKVLQSPLKRAIHLFFLKGGTLEEDQKHDAPEFLLEIMELNEEVEEADTPEKLKALHAKNVQKLKEITRDLSESFTKDDLQKAKEFIIKMKYYDSVSGHINGLLRERGIVD